MIGDLFSFSQLNGNFETTPPPRSVDSVLLGPAGHSADMVAQGAGIWHLSTFPEKGLEVSGLSLVNI